jgi:chemotaxis protein CheC
MPDITEDEKDTLKELFNIGIGRAASSLSEMVDDEVFLSVPYLTIVSREEAIEMIVERATDNITAIEQQFQGFFSGTALLVYPESSSLELVRTLIGDDIPLESLTELEQESLLEVGNVILNACLGSFANMMELELDFDLPEYFKGNCRALLSTQHSNPLAQCSANKKIVFLILDFKTGGEAKNSHVIKGFVMILLDTQAMVDLKSKLQQMLS